MFFIRWMIGYIQSLECEQLTLKEKELEKKLTELGKQLIPWINLFPGSLVFKSD